jgi:hypothetical protein
LTRPVRYLFDLHFADSVAVFRGCGNLIFSG